MFDLMQNHVRTAVERLGGPTKTAHLASVSNATIHVWLSSNRIPNIDKARIVAKEAGMDVQLLRGTR